MLHPLRIVLADDQPRGSDPAQPQPRRRRPSWPHVHRYRWAGSDPFSGSSLYACRCGVVRPGF